MGKFRMTVRVQIEPVQDGAQPEAAGGGVVDWVDESVTTMIEPRQAASIDDMDELLLDGGYEAMRRAMVCHLEQVSKKGLSTTRPHPRRSS